MRRERERELKKKKWSKPKLIILTRGKPEEGVLQVCKTVPPGVGGPDVADNFCELNLCGFCSEWFGT